MNICSRKIKLLLKFQLLKLSKTAINPELQEFFSDAVFAAVTPDRTTQVYLLFEHKSYDEPHIGVQIFENIAMVLEYHRKQHGRSARSPVIFPVVIYQSTTKRTINDQPIKTLRPFENSGDLLPDLNIRFVFLGLQWLPDNQIRGVPYLRILFLTLKYIHSPLID
jgi:predicted transposase/invertase (TIGR01784 family)